MKKGMIIGIVIVVILIILGGYFILSKNSSYAPASSNSNPSSISNPDKNTVEIQNFAFVPTELTISVGDTVTWENKDSASHTILSDSGTEISSGSLSMGQTYAHTFNAAGIFSYHCSIHPSMKAKIIVQ